MDAQVEVKPRQGPFVGDGTRMCRGSTTTYSEMESKFECLFIEWITKHEIKLAKIGNLRGPGQTYWIFWKRSEQQLQKLKIIDYIAVPHQVGNKKH